MSREIKFRYWTGLKMEYNVVVGHLGAFYALIDPNDSACLSPTTKYYNNEYLMEFTGVQDKKNVEIYENDLLVFDRNVEGEQDYKYTVIFKHGKFELKCQDSSMCIDIGYCREMLVVGNVFEK